MEPAVLGIVLDSSAIIAAERNKLEVSDFIERILDSYGAVELTLTPVTVAELAHGIFRAKSPGGFGMPKSLHRSAKAAAGGAKRKRNYADLAARSESVLREFLESAKAAAGGAKRKRNSAD